MKAFLHILQDILDNGTDWLGNRTDKRTKKVHFREFRHWLKDGYPLLTTKKVNPKTIFIELEGFLKGIRSKKWYQERGCFIWDEWCNPEVIKNYDFDDLPKLAEQLVHESMINKYDITKKIRKSLDKIIESFIPNPVSGHMEMPENADNEKYHTMLREHIQLVEDDLGPIYGCQWRDRNGVDQLANAINMLKENPLDRRIIVDAWAPEDLHKMALPPCHWSFEIHSDGESFDLKWNQRSVDTFLGLPFNIASYAMLMLLIEKETGLVAGELVGGLGDVHIYENHQEQVNTQLSREPRELPKVKVTVPEGKEFSIFEWTHEDYEITDYNPHPFIKAEVAV